MSHTLPAALCVAVAVGFQAAAVIGAQTPVAVETVAVTVKKLEKTIALPADLVAYQSVAIYPKVSGFVQSIPVDRGSWVKPGDPIAFLAAPEIEAQLLEAEARARRIASQRAEGEAKLAALEAELAAARASLVAAESNLGAAQAGVTGAQSSVIGAQAAVTGAEAALMGMRSSLTGAEAALTNAQATYDRLKKASETPGVVAGNDLDNALKTLEVQRAAVETQRASVDSQRAHVDMLRAGVETQRSTVASQQAVTHTQEARIQAQQAVIRAQEAGILAQRSAVEALRNEQAASEAAAGVTRSIKEYLRVTAPFAGIVTERNAHSGSLVSPNAGAQNPPLVRIDDVAKLRLTVGVPEAYVGAIGAGSAVTFTVPAFPNETFRGVIQRKAYALDPKTRAMPVEVDVDNAAARLAPGMFATVSWPVSRTAASFFVPPAAIVTTTEKTFVIAVRGGVATWVDVRRGVAEGGLMEVFGNLTPADIVVKRGIDEIRNGTQITTK